MKIRISRNWTTKQDIKWLFDNAEIIFIVFDDKRPRIHTRKKIEDKYSCFILDRDKYGITLNSMGEYSESFFGKEGASELVRATRNRDMVLRFFERLMIGYADRFVNPKPRLFEFMRSKKDKIIEL